MSKIIKNKTENYDRKKYNLFIFIKFLKIILIKKQLNFFDII